MVYICKHFHTRVGDNAVCSEVIAQCTYKPHIESVLPLKAKGLVMMEQCVIIKF